MPEALNQHRDVRGGPSITVLVCVRLLILTVALLGIRVGPTDESVERLKLNDSRSRGGKEWEIFYLFIYFL